MVLDPHVKEDQGDHLEVESLVVLPQHLVVHHSTNQLFDVMPLILVGYLELIDLNDNFRQTDH